MSAERDDLATTIAKAPGAMNPYACADAILAAGWVGPAENERMVARALARRLSIVRAERDALAATVQRVRALLTTGPIGRQTGERYIPAWEVRVALAAPSDPATDTGGEG